MVHKNVLILMGPGASAPSLDGNRHGIEFKPNLPTGLQMFFLQVNSSEQLLVLKRNKPKLIVLCTKDGQKK
jgi:hypothetical protein